MLVLITPSKSREVGSDFNQYKQNNCLKVSFFKTFYIEKYALLFHSEKFNVSQVRLKLLKIYLNKGTIFEKRVGL